MADRLRVDYKQIMNVIEEMKACEKKVEDTYSSMNNDVMGLQTKGYMDGESAGAYIKEFEEMLAPEIEELQVLVGKYYQQLSEVCENFAEVDKRIAAVLS